jgi:hypothetical protein
MNSVKINHKQENSAIVLTGFKPFFAAQKVEKGQQVSSVFHYYCNR